MCDADEEKEAEEFYTDCIGADNKKHICKSHEKETLCGIAIKRKILLKNDYILFSCYECTY